MSVKDCRTALQNIVGLDIDANAIEKCRSNLDAVLVACNKPFKICWNLHCIDSTCRASLAPFKECFDYVIGNPPYVRIQHLGVKRRTRLQQDWRLASLGSTDMYIAFFEIGMWLLKQSGKLGYITPNTYVKTAAGQSLRRFILEHHSIICMIDFCSYQVFKDATTYSLITVLSKNDKFEKFALWRYEGKNIVDKGTVSSAMLSSKGIWILESENTLRKIEKIRTRGRPLREVADIHVGLQTLADNVFILNKKREESNLVIVSDRHGCEVQIEAALTRPILKASVMKCGQDIKNRIIIFPYQNGRLITETHMQEQFPFAYQYLTRHKTELLKRDKGNFNANKWYAFGREFGLTTTFGDKIITPGMSKSPNFQKCLLPDHTFYSGYCIKPKIGIDIDKLLQKLNSAEMDFYIRHVSRDYQNGWKSYAKSFIQDYGVPVNMAVCQRKFQHELLLNDF